MASSEPQGPVARAYRFAAFELRTLPHELLLQGESVDLAPQPLRLLELLVSHPGEVVSREAIRQVLWGAATHVDFDRGINFNIRQIRRQLGDDPGHPRFVETVPRSGYRFIAVVERGTAHEMPPRLRQRRWLWPAAALLVLLLLGLPAVEKLGRQGPVLGAERADYERGRLLLEQNNPPARIEAIRAFSQAVEQEAGWAPAQAGLARAHFRQERFDEAREAAAAALRLDPSQPEARYVQALLRLFFDLQWEEAEQDLLVALEAEDALPEALILYADLLCATGRPAEATRLLEEAAKGAPLEPRFVQGLTLSLFLERRYEDSIAWGRRGLELAPGTFFLHRLLINSLAFEGRTEEAVVAANRYLETYGWRPDVIQSLEDWWRICLKNATLPEPGPLSAYYSTRASWLVSLGREDEALEELDAACRDKLVLDLAFLPLDPRFDPLRRHPRFHEILRCLPVQDGGAGDPAPA